MTEIDAIPRPVGFYRGPLTFEADLLFSIVADGEGYRAVMQPHRCDVGGVSHTWTACELMLTFGVEAIREAEAEALETWEERGGRHSLRVAEAEARERIRREA